MRVRLSAFFTRPGASLWPLEDLPNFVRQRMNHWIWEISCWMQTCSEDTVCPLETVQFSEFHFAVNFLPQSETFEFSEFHFSFREHTHTVQPLDWGYAYFRKPPHDLKKKNNWDSERAATQVISWTSSTLLLPGGTLFGATANCCASPGWSGGSGASISGSISGVPQTISGSPMVYTVLIPFGNLT